MGGWSINKVEGLDGVEVWIYFMDWVLPILLHSYSVGVWRWARLWDRKPRAKMGKKWETNLDNPPPPQAPLDMKDYTGIKSRFDIPLQVGGGDGGIFLHNYTPPNNDKGWVGISKYCFS